MRLCTLKAFRSLIYAPGSEPSMATLRAKVGAGKVPGGQVDGGRYYVDLDEFDRRTGTSDKLRGDIRELEKTPELEGLL